MNQKEILKKIQDMQKEVVDVYNDRLNRKCKDWQYWNGRADQLKDIILMLKGEINQEEIKSDKIK